MLKKFFVDLDGVLVDFAKGAIGVGWTTYNKDKGDAENAGWEKIKNTPHFYANLKPIDGAINLFNNLVYAKGKKRVEILSSVPKEKRGIITAEEDKLEWCKKYLPEGIKVNLCLRSEKKNFCEGKHCVLIDDLDSNCKDWEKAGGTAIRFTSVEDAYRKLHGMKIIKKNVLDDYINEYIKEYCYYLRKFKDGEVGLYRVEKSRSYLDLQCYLVPDKKWTRASDLLIDKLYYGELDLCDETDGFKEIKEKEAIEYMNEK